MELMQLSFVDYLIIAAYLILALGIGMTFSRRAGKNIEEFFISGRALPWWIAGTSMVATTFAADTPLAVTGLVIKNGISGNWVWWSMAVGGMLTVFLYARLWRRAKVITDVELIELRYGGAPASFLRGFRALYLALPMNCIIVGWVTNAMVDVIKYTIGVPPAYTIIILLSVTAIYSILSGLWGVVITDFFQFILAMAGCIVLAIIAIGQANGMGGLIDGLRGQYGEGVKQSISFLPDFAGGPASWMPMLAFLTYVGVTWWASWYPGAEPGGGGYVVQRMASCKNEKHSLLATLWFQVSMYALRPWPWILVGLVALFYFPELRTAPDADIGFPKVMTMVLPAGLRGLLLVAFFAAFMSTISTQINWGASYVVNDFYKRFIKPDASARHYTLISRIATALILILGGLISIRIKEVAGAWKFMLAIGAGTGLVFLLRWYWWRINAWSEISSMAAALTISSCLFIWPKQISGLLGFELRDYHQILFTAAGTTAIWIIVTLLTRPEKQDILKSFYQKVRPGGWLWAPIKQIMPEVEVDKKLYLNFIAWIFGAGLVYLALFGIGKIIFGQTLLGISMIGLGFVCGLIIYVILSQMGWEKVLK